MERTATNLGIVVLGTGRSGTSAIARVLACCGFYAGRESDLLAANAFNPHGYFEQSRIVDLNEEVLAELGASWYEPPPHEAQLRLPPEVADRMRAALDGLLAESGSRPLVLKDPRIGVMLELWGPVLCGRVHPVLAVRDPLDVALSLRRRDGTPIPFGLAIWELHTTGLLSALHQRRVTVAPYARLFESPHAASEMVADAAAELLPDRAAQVHPGQAGRGLQASERRSQAAPGTHRATLTIHQLELWEWLHALDIGTQRLDVPGGLLDDGDSARAAVAAERARREADQQLRLHQAWLEAAAREKDRLIGLVRSEQARLEAALRAEEQRGAELQIELERARTGRSPSRASPP